MIKSEDFLNCLKKNNVNFYTGVPDSLFADLCHTFQIKEKNKHILATNEGAALGMAIGYFLSTKKVPLVYLQNSGIGNIINPLLSLVDKKIFDIPIFFLIGWRGEIIKKKQIKDEPQHKKQGAITTKLLKILDIKTQILHANSDFKKIIKNLKLYAQKYNKPVAILIRKNSFKKIKFNYKKINSNQCTREMALKEVFQHLPKNIPKISTTGMLSRELYEINKIENCQKNTFMTIGGMGHAVSIATGIGFNKNKKKIICLDGDGSALMHLGSLANSAKIKNLVHVVFNNFAHDSVGGHVPPSEKINFTKLAKNIGYSNSYKIKNIKNIKSKIKLALKNQKSTFIEIICVKGHRNNLSRPKKSAVYYKKIFMKFLKKC
jgi:phosphonopyruvate decarboxylase